MIAELLLAAGATAAGLIPYSARLIAPASGALGGFLANRAMQFWQARFGTDNSPPGPKREQVRRRARLLVWEVYAAGLHRHPLASLRCLVRLHKTERQLLNSVGQIRSFQFDVRDVFSPELQDLLKDEADQLYQHPLAFEDQERFLFETLASRIPGCPALQQSLIGDASRLAAIVRRLYEYHITRCQRLSHHELHEATALSVADINEIMRTSLKRMERRLSCCIKKIHASHQENGAKLEALTVSIAELLRPTIPPSTAPEPMPNSRRWADWIYAIVIMALVASQIAVLIKLYCY